MRPASFRSCRIRPTFHARDARLRRCNLFPTTKPIGDRPSGRGEADARGGRGSGCHVGAAARVRGADRVRQRPARGRAPVNPACLRKPWTPPTAAVPVPSGASSSGSERGAARRPARCSSGTHRGFGGGLAAGCRSRCAAPSTRATWFRTRCSRRSCGSAASRRDRPARCEPTFAERSRTESVTSCGAPPVTDVADALTLDQEVEWERCAGLATPANRRVLDSLRSFGAIFAGRPAADAALRSGPPTSTEPFADARVRRVLHALLAIAAVDVAAALLVLSATWNDYRGEHGELAVFLTTLFLGHVATACVLLLAGRGDQRAWLLGGFFLLKATLAPLHMVYASVWEIQPHLIEALPWKRLRRPSCSLTSTYSRSCSRPLSSGRSLASARVPAAGPGSMASRVAWCRSALGSAARCGSRSRCRSSSRRQGRGRR